MSNPPQRSLRLRAYDTNYINSTSGSDGEIFFDGNKNTLVISNGPQPKTELLKADLSNLAGSGDGVLTFDAIEADTVTATTFYGDGSQLTGVLAEVTTTLGDLSYRGPTQDQRLPIGNENKVLTVKNGLPSWDTTGDTLNVYYVTADGSNANDGRSINTGFASISYACAQATGPATIYVKAGTYTESLPIVVPSFVSIVGDSIRTTIVQPAAGDSQKVMWKLSDGTLLNKMHFIGLTGYVPNDTNVETAIVGGTYVAFNELSPILVKSPYVLECTAKSAGGIGAIVDGSVHSSGYKSMVFHGYTIICDDGIGYWINGDGKSEIVSCFTYYCHIGYVSTGGGKIRSLNGNNSYGTYGALSKGYNLNEITVNGNLYGTQLVYLSLSGGSFTKNNTITGQTSGTVATITNVQASTNKLYIKITSGTGFTAGESFNNGSGVSAVVDTGGATGQKGFVLVVSGLSVEPKIGSSLEITGDPYSYVIQSVTEYGTAPGSSTIILLAGEKPDPSNDNAAVIIRNEYSQVRLTGHDFLNVGTGNSITTNYPGTPSQPPAQGNETVELFPGRVFYTSTDQDGNFRVGEYFRVDQATGRATLNASAFDLSGLTSLRLGSIGAQLGETINEFSSDNTLSGNSNVAVPTEQAVKQYFTKVSSNLVPSEDNVYTLGTPTKKWNHLYVGAGSVTIGNITLTDNSGTLGITANESSAPISINSINNGTSSVAVANNGNVTVTAGGTTSATFSSTGTTIEGNLTVNGTTTTINSTVVTIDDKNIELASVASPTNTTANGAGITVRGTTNKTFNWLSNTTAWTSSEHLDLASGKAFYIDGSQVLSNTTLGSTVTGSSLTSVGTITSGTWSGSFGSVSGANLTSLTAGNLSGTIPSGVLGNSSLFIGTTSIALNRGSASQTLTGVSIDGSAGSAGSAGSVGNDLTFTNTGGAAAGTTYNGSAARTIDFSTVGAAASSHTHNYAGSASAGGAATSLSNFTVTTTTSVGAENTTSTIGYISGISLLGQSDGALYSHLYSADWKHQIYGDYRTGQIAIRGKNSGTWQAWRTVLDSSNYTSYSPTLTGGSASGTWGISITGSSASTTGNAATATALIGDESNWASYRTRSVANMLSWKNYGNGHIIFDASNSTSPTGSAVNNTNSANAWSDTHPTLMGWNGSSTYGVRVDSARIADTLTTGNNYQVNSLGVGTAASGTAGEIRATNNITAYYSDKRLKNILGTIPNALEKINSISGVYFTQNEKAEEFGYDNYDQQVGVIAQEIQKILPEAIKPAPFDIEKDEDGNEYSKSGEKYLTVQYEKLVPLLIEGIKEQQKIIDSLKFDIEQLKINK